MNGLLVLKTILLLRLKNNYLVNTTSTNETKVNIGVTTDVSNVATVSVTVPTAIALTVVDDQANSIFGVLVGEVEIESDEESTLNASPTTQSSISFINKSKDGSGEGLEVYITKATVTAGTDSWTLISSDQFDNTSSEHAYKVGIGIDVEGDSVNFVELGSATGITNGAKNDVDLGITLKSPTATDLASNGRTTSADIEVSIGGMNGDYENATDVAQAFTIEWVISTKDYSTAEDECIFMS